MKWIVTCEHTQGASTGHPCKTGVFEDPADCWEIEVTGESHQAAVRVGRERLRRDLRNWRTCDCVRHMRPGSQRWWASIAIDVAPVRFGDDERAAYLRAEDDERLAMIAALGK